MTTVELNGKRRVWLSAQLEHAAGLLGAIITASPVFGWHDRTIGTRVSTVDGERWLRVVAEMSHWAGGALWTGNLDARAISGVPKPRLLTNLDWSDGDCQLRAELMTVAPSPVIANDMVLRDTPDLTPTWWAALRRAVDALAAHSTERVCVAGSGLRLRLLAAFGVDIDAVELEWTCAHGDLHWANLTAPRLTLLDWEAWGMAPAGYDAAVLYCASILRRDVLHDVRETFADLLESPSGRVAQLAAILKLLCLVEDGEHLDIAAPLHRHARTLLATHGAGRPGA
ncbi:MAG: aminoglycoside phosphotransferase [Pseudonocardiales bacterium]|nr:aminoglycoside phosphotransferase [Pseudonocardiales bacterium]